MRMTFVWMGRTRERFLQDGIGKYLRFLRSYADVEVRELKAEKVLELKDAPAIRKKEAERIFKTVPAGAALIALDERGREFTSHEFAAFLQAARDRGIREMCFVIGGAMGLDESVTGNADRTLAISRWTLTHEMARLVLLEQIYRAFTIITGKTYHY